MSNLTASPVSAVAGASATAGRQGTLGYQGPPGGSPRESREPLVSGKGRRFGADAALRGLTLGSAVLVLLMITSLVAVLFHQALPSITKFGVGFLTHSTWRPNTKEIKGRPRKDAHGKIVRDEDDQPILKPSTFIQPEFGALPVIYGTLFSAGIALLFAVPLSFGCALFLVRISPRWLTAPVSFLVEFLAAIPSIAYGIWGLFVLTPFLANYVEPGLNRFFEWVPFLRWLQFDTVTGRDMFCGGLVLGIMVVPIITAVSRDVLRAVPVVQIEGTMALGATWWQSAWEMLRFSRSGLFGAVMLGFARAAGETMAVTMVIGNVSEIHSSPFAPAQTMASLLASQFGNPESPLHLSALLEVALVLLVMSLILNVVARWLVVGGNARTSAAH